MALRISYTRLALSDIAEAAAYIARDDPNAAKLVVDRIRAAVSGLALHPELGRPGRIRGTRELVVPRTPFVVPYRIAGDRIDILAVIHGRRAWPASL